MSYKINKIDLQRIEKSHVKAAYTLTVASDKTICSNLLQKQSKKLIIITHLVDALALLGKAVADLNQFWRNNLRFRLPKK